MVLFVSKAHGTKISHLITPSYGPLWPGRGGQGEWFSAPSLACRQCGLSSVWNHTLGLSLIPAYEELSDRGYVLMTNLVQMLKMIAIYIFNTIKPHLNGSSHARQHHTRGSGSDKADTHRELIFFVCPLPFPLVAQNNQQEVKQDRRKAAYCCNAMDEKEMDKPMAPEKSVPAQATVCELTQVSMMRPLRAKFSADVAGLSHTILMNGPGNPALETSALGWEFSPLF